MYNDGIYDGEIYFKFGFIINRSLTNNINHEKLWNRSTLYIHTYTQTRTDQQKKKAILNEWIFHDIIIIYLDHSDRKYDDYSHEIYLDIL